MNEIWNNYTRSDLLTNITDIISKNAKRYLDEALIDSGAANIFKRGNKFEN